VFQIADIFISKVGRDIGLEVSLEEGQPESYHKRQCPKGLQDYHSARGAHGAETTEQPSVSVTL
jgi:hypothetical protein